MGSCYAGIIISHDSKVVNL